jgi:hypothetical protein
MLFPMRRRSLLYLSYATPLKWPRTAVAMYRMAMYGENFIVFTKLTTKWGWERRQKMRKRNQIVRGLRIERERCQMVAGFRLRRFVTTVNVKERWTLRLGDARSPLRTRTARDISRQTVCLRTFFTTVYVCVRLPSLVFTSLISKQSERFCPKMLAQNSRDSEASRKLHHATVL